MCGGPWRRSVAVLIFREGGHESMFSEFVRAPAPTRVGMPVGKPERHAAALQKGPWGLFNTGWGVVETIGVSPVLGERFVRRRTRLRCCGRPRAFLSTMRARPGSVRSMLNRRHRYGRDPGQIGRAHV